MKTKKKSKAAETPRSTDGHTVLVTLADLKPEVRERIERERDAKRARAKAMTVQRRPDVAPRIETDYASGHGTDDGGYGHEPSGRDGVVIAPADKDAEGRVRPGTTVVANPTPTNTAGVFAKRDDERRVF